MKIVVMTAVLNNPGYLHYYMTCQHIQDMRLLYLDRI